MRMRIAGWWMAAAMAVVVTTAFGEGQTEDTALTPAAVTLENEVQNWDGTPKAVTVKTEPAELAVKVTYDGSETLPSAAGAYPVVAEVTEEGYEGRAEGSLIIVEPGQWMVVDLSGGTNAAAYPVSFPDREPEYSTNTLIFRRIPAGTYTMGSPENEVGRGQGAMTNTFENVRFDVVEYKEETQRTVILTNDYWMEAYAVLHWRLITPAKIEWDLPSYEDLRGSSQGMTWPQANWMDEGSILRILRDKTGLTFDLPTEEQWEYACRAGTTTALYSGWNLTTPEKCPHLENLPWQNAWGMWGMLKGWERCLNRLGAKEAIVRGGGDLFYRNPASCRAATRGVTDTGSGGSIYEETGHGFSLPVEGISSRLVCPVDASLTFERIGNRYCTEKVKLTATTGTEGLGWVTYAVVDGVGVVSGDELTFRGAGTTTVRASVGDWTNATQTITVKKTPARVWLEDVMQYSDGLPKTVRVVTEPADLAVEVTYDEKTVAPTAAGTYMVTATVKDDWYEGSATGTFWVVARTVVDVQPGRYLSVDLSGGPEAVSFPTQLLDGPPLGGWGDEYKTTKLLLRKVDAGIFTMGSPYGELGRQTNETPHAVTLTDAHWMGVFEVTQKQWELVTGKNPAIHQGANRPVENVSYDDIRGAEAGTNWPTAAWVDAGSFLGTLRAKTGLTFDLPTEAQWEHACRAGTTTALNSGRDLLTTNQCLNLAELGRYTNNLADGRGGHSGGTTDVGTYLPNAWGLYDMHGNAAEWCLDGENRFSYWGSSSLIYLPIPQSYGSSAVTNPVGVMETNRVVRGGGWTDWAEGCRSARREVLGHSNRNARTGFRLECAAGRDIVFEPIGTRLVTEKVALRVSSGVEGRGSGWSFGVASGPGEVKDGILSFTGVGEVVVTATVGPGGGHGAVTLAQTAVVERVEAKVTVGGKAHVYDGTPKGVTVETEPTGLDVRVTYNGSTNEPTAPGLYRVRVDAVGEFVEGEEECTMVIVKPGRYLVVDLSGGPGAERFPVRELAGVPEGGWSEEYKTEKLVLRWVEPGRFMMGSPESEPGRPERAEGIEEWDIGYSFQYYYPLEEPHHSVDLTEGYWLGVFELTQRQWELVMGNNPSSMAGADRPVEQVSYDMIRGATAGGYWPTSNAVDEDSFMGVLRKKTELVFDLPTEAQWEMACRAGTTTGLNSGRELTDPNECPHMAEVARYAGNGAGAGTAPVGQYLPNEWGLHDMHGNVGEWCFANDYSHQMAYDWEYALSQDYTNSLPQTDPKGGACGIKGGAWNLPAHACRSAARVTTISRSTNFWANGVRLKPGFRVACGAGEVPGNPYTEESPVAVEKAWLDRYAAALAAAGGDYEVAAVADWDGDGAAAWEEYVAGTSPEDKGDVFKVTGWTWEGGEMVPEYGPKDEGTRTYTVEAADEVGETYKPIPEVGAAGSRRFYRVRVEMK